jgi:hypothetical protein
MNAKMISATISVFFTAIDLHGAEDIDKGFFKLIQLICCNLRIFFEEEALGRGSRGSRGRKIQCPMPNAQCPMPHYY